MASPNLFLLLLYCMLWCTGKSMSETRPNIILIVADDLGYGDLASYGHPTQEWNFLDKMAAEGTRFTQFYSAATFCTPSRAALLTGRLPVRIGITGDKLPVFLPGHSTGLPQSELTIAELLRENGYNTGMVGKWHLGINEFNSTDGGHLPDKHGFNYVGTILPFSLESCCDDTKRHRNQPRTARCFLYDHNKLIQQPLTFTNLTFQMVQDAQAFIYNHQNKGQQSRKHQQSQQQQSQRKQQRQQKQHQEPFFLYLPLLQPHTPMFSDPRFKGASRRGEYGDQIVEMAWAVEEVMKTVHEVGQGQNTLVVFVSDHGPHREMCAEGGSTGPFRGGKSNFYEGGIRIPAIFWWPNHIRVNPSDPRIGSLMDIFLTLADFSQSRPPSNLQLDGISLMDNLVGPDFRTNMYLNIHYNSETKIKIDKNETINKRALFFYCQRYLTAVRYDNYKIHFRYQRIVEDYGFSHCTDGISNQDFYTDDECDKHTVLDPPRVYDVEVDPGERFPLSEARAKYLLIEINKLVEEHKRTMVLPQCEVLNVEYMSDQLVPCCNWPYCVCN